MRPRRKQDMNSRVFKRNDPKERNVRRIKDARFCDLFSGEVETKAFIQDGCQENTRTYSSFGSITDLMRYVGHQFPETTTNLSNEQSCEYYEETSSSVGCR